MMQGYYTKNGGLRGLGHLGQAADAVSMQPVGQLGVDQNGTPQWVWWAWRAASMAGTGIGAYHGYKRNRGSVGWAIGWALLGGMFPVITVPIAFAQGLGKPKVQRNRRRRRRTSRR
jgi:hypothetical protein